MFQIAGGLRLPTDALIRIVAESTIRSSALLLVAVLVALALKPRSAAHRHLLWTMAIVAALAMPLLSRVVPPLEVGWSFRIPGIGAPAAPDAPEPVLAPAALEPALPPAPGPDVAPLPDARTPGTDAVAAPRPPVEDARGRRVEVQPEPARSTGNGALLSAASTAARGATTPDRPTPPASPRGSRLSPGLLLAALWGLGALGVLGGLIVNVVRLDGVRRRATPVDGGPLWATLQRACLRLRLNRSIRLYQGDDTTMPMTWGTRRPILVLPAGAESWERSRLEGVLLHELGHVTRRDYLAQMAARVACALYWFNPLVWVAAHRMLVERELACDDLVVATGHGASRYADDLIDLARTLRSPRPRAGAALSMIRGGQLKGRLLAILDEGRNRRPLTRGRAIAATVATLAAAVAIALPTPSAAAAREVPVERVVDVVAPIASPATTRGGAASWAADDEPVVPIPAPSLVDAPTAPPRVQEATTLCGPADGEARQRRSMTNDDVHSVEAEYDRCRSSVRVEGDIEFTRDFSSIARLSPGASLRISVERDGSSRVLAASPGAGGRPEYAWTVDGRSLPFDAAAERWLASALLDFFRSSGYMARERVAWLLSTRGPEGVFDEVEQMTADHAQATYLTILVEDGNLNGGQVRDAIELAGREIASDHSLGEFLVGAAGRYPFDAATRTAFLAAARSLESDHTQGRVFQTALGLEGLSEADLATLLEEAAADIESDHTLGEILRELATRYPLEPALREPFLRAAATIESDHTAGEVYRALLEQPSLRPADLVDVLSAAGQIESDHTLSTLLIELAGRGLPDSATQRAFLATARGIESDHDLWQTLAAFARMDDVGEAEQVALLESARAIGSDHSLAELLVEFAGLYTVRGAVRDAFLVTLEGVGSRYDRERVTSMLSGS